MTTPQQLSISDYTYTLPEEKIALHPLIRRDDSKLLLYNSGHISEANFKQLPSFLPSQSLLVFNNTQVIPARLLFQKPTGGQIEIFVLEPVPGNKIGGAMVQQGSLEYLCLVKGIAKWKAGALQKTVTSESTVIVLEAVLLEKQADAFKIRFDWSPQHLSFAEVLQALGEMPIPPYLHRAAETEDAERYQTIYAKHQGSVAAPTAGLHFTNDVMLNLRQKNIGIAYTTLHVGAGTFKPVKSETIGDHEMHMEWMNVDKKLLTDLLKYDTVIPVGTTSMRTLESLYWLGLKIMQHPQIAAEDLTLRQWEVYQSEWPSANRNEVLNAILTWMNSNGLDSLITQTQILIAPGYQFKICKGIVTNFHQPQSTLLLLIAALIGEDWRRVYEFALNNQFRFLSYGDSSLLLP